MENSDDPAVSQSTTISHQFTIAGQDGFLAVEYLTIDGAPKIKDLKIIMGREGSTMHGLLSAFALAITTALDHGTPLQAMCEKFTGTRFDPAGFTGNPQIPRTSSIADYIFRWLKIQFLPIENETA